LTTMINGKCSTLKYSVVHV